MKKEIITIGGMVGSGKSSTAKALAARLNYEHFSSGDLFRSLATQKGISIEQINHTAESQKEIDHAVDGLLRDMYENKQKIIIDSRMAWHWMHGSFKVFLTLEPQIAGERIFNHIQSVGRVSENAASVDEVIASNERRFASEQRRYRDLYNIDPTNPLNFDMVLNTGKNDLETVIDMIYASYTSWLGRK